MTSLNHFDPLSASPPQKRKKKQKENELDSFDMDEVDDALPKPKSNEKKKKHPIEPSEGESNHPKEQKPKSKLKKKIISPPDSSSEETEEIPQSKHTKSKPKSKRTKKKEELKFESESEISEKDEKPKSQTSVKSQLKSKKKPIEESEDSNEENEPKPPKSTKSTSKPKLKKPFEEDEDNENDDFACDSDSTVRSSGKDPRLWSIHLSHAKSKMGLNKNCIAWKFVHKGKSHTVELFHSTFGGKRTIRVDGVTKISEKKMLDNGSKYHLDCGSGTAHVLIAVEIKMVGVNGCTYELYIDGRDYDHAKRYWLNNDTV